MGWPPKVGELLPRAEEAVGVREKLAGYSLNRGHKDGGAKARGFEQILGITLESISYLEAQIHLGIRQMPMSSVRKNEPYGINCVVEFPLQGIGDLSDRSVNLRTIWLVRADGMPPRLLSALLKP
jgi:hypothetical protein